MQFDFHNAMLTCLCTLRFFSSKYAIMTSLFSPPPFVIEELNFSSVKILHKLGNGRKLKSSAKGSQTPVSPCLSVLLSSDNDLVVYVDLSVQPHF